MVSALCCQACLLGSPWWRQSAELAEAPERFHLIRDDEEHSVSQTGTFEYYRAEDDSHVSREALDRLDRLAWMLDSVWRIPGTNIRFGADAVMGLVPGLGDIAGAALSLYLINEARRLGAPASVITRMIGNVALDTVVGAVPVAGSVFDIAFRANRRNMRVLREHLGRFDR
jgi:hypothetical protein